MSSDYLPHTIYRRLSTGADGNGQPTFGAAASIAARWVQKRKLVRNAEGEQVISDVTVLLGPTDEVAPGDQLSRDGESYLDIITAEEGIGLGGEVTGRIAYL